jgi:hypothetical protein
MTKTLHHQIKLFLLAAAILSCGLIFSGEALAQEEYEYAPEDSGGYSESLPAENYGAGADYGDFQYDFPQGNAELMPQLPEAKPAPGVEFQDYQSIPDFGGYGPGYSLPQGPGFDFAPGLPVDSYEDVSGGLS